MNAQQTLDHLVPRLDMEAHPCFNHAARLTHARVHLPVAARCNMQCKYCNRKYDCVNESRPGVTCMVMLPTEAVPYIKEIASKTERLSVVGIAGPGDPFANADETMETLRLVREAFPDILLCVATNGLNLFPYIPALAELAVSHVTITINAVDPVIGAQIYWWIADGEVRLEGIEAATLLWVRQERAIIALRAYGIVVKINTILIPTINEYHVTEVAETVAKVGASLFNLMPMYPVAETPFAALPEPIPGQVNALRTVAGRFLPQMTHCTRCRADAVGLLHESGCSAALQDFKEKLQIVQL